VTLRAQTITTVSHKLANAIRKNISCVT